MAEKTGSALYQSAGPDTMNAHCPETAAAPVADRLLALLNGEKVPEKPKEERLPDPELYTKSQAASLMQVSIRTLDRLVTRGEIPNIRFGRRCVRFPIVALKKWLESKTKSNQER